MNKLPLARTRDIVMQDFGQEILLYDLNINKAICLNQTASLVFKHCDGVCSLTDLKLKNSDLTDEIIFLTLDLLAKESLLQVNNYQSRFDGLSRREVIRKVGLASVIALPLISSIIAPNAAAAQSGGCFFEPCVFDNYNQGNCCNSNFRCAVSPNFCTACLGSNEKFAFAAPAADDAFCNSGSVGSKNYCCNSGPATGDGSYCYCP
jgi:hypothetical protein